MRQRKDKGTEARNGEGMSVQEKKASCGNVGAFVGDGGAGGRESGRAGWRVEKIPTSFCFTAAAAEQRVTQEKNGLLVLEEGRPGCVRREGEREKRRRGNSSVTCHGLLLLLLLGPSLPEPRLSFQPPGDYYYGMGDGRTDGTL